MIKNFEGNLVSLSFNEVLNRCLASFRGTQKYPRNRHVVKKFPKNCNINLPGCQKFYEISKKKRKKIQKNLKFLIFQTFKLAEDFGSSGPFCVTENFGTIQGGQAMKIMSRSSLAAMPGGAGGLVCFYDEDCKEVKENLSNFFNFEQKIFRFYCMIWKVATKFH